MTRWPAGPTPGAPTDPRDERTLDALVFRLPRPGRRSIPVLARWLVAAVLAGTAALLLAGPHPAPGAARAAGEAGVRGRAGGGPLVPVVVAARELRPGARLRASDLRRRRLPAADIPRGALRDAAPVIGRTTAGPVRTGEILTDVRLLGPPLVRAAAGAGAVAAAVRIADPAAVGLVQPGDRVDIVGTDTRRDGAAPVTLASDVAVVAVPAAGRAAQVPAVAGSGALLVVATAPAVAQRLAGASLRDSLSVVVRAR